MIERTLYWHKVHPLEKEESYKEVNPWLMHLKLATLLSKSPKKISNLIHQ